MSLQKTGINNQQTRDELSSEPNIQPIYKIKSETVKVEEGATKTTTISLGDSWIVGSATNAIVGTNTGTEGGGQQVVGASGRVTTVKSISSPGKRFPERFNTTTFEDTGVTTADWADTTGSLIMTNTEIAQSLSVAFADGTITTANMIVTLSAGVIGDLTIQLSADGGSNFENVTNGTTHSFTNTGTDLKFKLTATGNVTVDSVIINYG